MKKSDLNLMTLEQGLGNRWRNLDSRIKLTVFCTLLWGLVAHGTVLFNKFCLHDDATFTYMLGATVDSGRWMLELLSALERAVTGGGHYSMPLLNGLASLVYIAVAAGVLVDLFDIRSRWLCAAVGGAMVSIPCITGLLGFMFTAPYYLLAMLATVVAAAMVCRSRKWYVVAIAAALMSCAMGVYQAYISMAIGIVLIHFFLERSRQENADWKGFFCRAICYGFVICAAVLSYYILSKVFLKLYQTQLNNYQGINKMGREGISVYLGRLVLAYKAFFLPELLEGASAHLVVMGLKLPYRLLLVLTGGLSLLLVVRAGKKSFWLGAQMAAMAALLPLALCFIYVMGPDVHVLMVYAQVLLFVFGACLADRLCREKELLIRLLCLVLCLLMLLFPVLWTRYSNALYLNVALSQQQTISYFTTLVTQIKSAEGYRDELPIAYIGGFKSKTDKTLSPVPEFPWIRPYENSADLVNDASSKQFLERWCGFWAEEVEFDHPDIAAMPCYPDAGSIRVIEDVVVVKFR